jgi:hypothetical protein
MTPLPGTLNPVVEHGTLLNCPIKYPPDWALAVIDPAEFELQLPTREEDPVTVFTPTISGVDMFCETVSSITPTTPVESVAVTPKLKPSSREALNPAPVSELLAFTIPPVRLNAPEDHEKESVADAPVAKVAAIPPYVNAVELVEPSRYTSEAPVGMQADPKVPVPVQVST